MDRSISADVFLCVVSRDVDFFDCVVPDGVTFEMSVDSVSLGEDIASDVT